MFFATHNLGSDSTFHQRLMASYDASSDTPSKVHGRNVWMADRMREHGVVVSPESVRKWFAGLTQPRGDTMVALAQALGVSAEWLETGVVPAAKPAPSSRTDPSSPDPADIERLFDTDDILWDDEPSQDPEAVHQETVAAGYVAARLMFAGAGVQVARDRVLFSVDGKAREVAVVLLHKVVDRPGAWVGRLPADRSGFPPIEKPFDLMMLVLPRGPARPMLYAMIAKAAHFIGEPHAPFTVIQGGKSEWPTLTIPLISGKDAEMNPIADFSKIVSPRPPL
ncbi:helix-turn-helix domain-containing protein [Paracoccus sanguinis]|uniref:HTH cro/C1-type domain-containing protein n=1 Tax=Paracoccus sanguinis TaxID=1545044 RepID=A0A099GMF9_9RHOB|nr:helix-turn-helix domain-containing protein [Paracoccus sanguinis]KGJ23727.1 hypothetical protein IX56_00135 [Paracoccus sanguinis]